MIVSDFYPAFFVRADTKAKRTKFGFLLLRGLELALTLGAVFFGATDFLGPNSIKVSIGLLGGAILMRLLTFALRFEEKWIAARTVTESCKKETWQYACRLSVYRCAERQAMQEYVGALKRLAESGKLPIDSGNGPLITKAMEGLRKKPWTKRRNFYFQERLLVQMAFYNSARDKSQWRHNGFSSFTLAAQVTALALAIWTVVGTPDFRTYVKILAAGAAFCLGWVNIAKYQATFNDYREIADSLERKKIDFASLRRSPDFETRVDEIEEIISRENTNWSIYRR